MAGKQGNTKRYGRNKVSCGRYYSEGRLGKNKLTRFIKNNIGKDWPQTQIDKAISEFKDLHYQKHQKHNLSSVQKTEL